MGIIGNLGYSSTSASYWTSSGVRSSEQEEGESSVSISLEFLVENVPVYLYFFMMSLAVEGLMDRLFPAPKMDIFYF